MGGRIEGRPVSNVEAKFHVDRFDANQNNSLECEEFLQLMHSRRTMRKEGALVAFDEMSDEEEKETEKKIEPAAPMMPGVQIDWSVDALRIRAEKLQRDQEALNKELEQIDESDESAEEAFPPAAPEEEDKKVEENE